MIWESGFNYSAINNFGEKSASGEYLLFLNNDVEVINPHWIEEMLGNCQRKEVGIVGANCITRTIRSSMLEQSSESAGSPVMHS